MLTFPVFPAISREINSSSLVDTTLLNTTHTIPFLLIFTHHKMEFLAEPKFRCCCKFVEPDPEARIRDHRSIGPQFPGPRHLCWTLPYCGREPREIHSLQMFLKEGEVEYNKKIEKKNFYLVNGSFILVINLLFLGTGYFFAHWKNLKKKWQQKKWPVL